MPGVPKHEAGTEVNPRVLHPKERGRHVVQQVYEERDVTQQEQAGEHHYSDARFVFPRLCDPGLRLGTFHATASRFSSKQTTDGQEEIDES